MLDDPFSKQVAELTTRILAYVKDKPFTLNPDKDMVNAVIKAMAMRHAKYGKDYCPCRRVTDDPEVDEKIICPCVYHLDELETQGHCHCYLFTREV